MLDARIRPLIDPPLDAMGRRIARAGIAADTITIAGFLLGLAAAVAIVFGRVDVALWLFLAGRLADGLDGAVARASVKTDRGGYLDIVLDFILYGAIPLAFAILDPARNALPAAVLLMSFFANGTTFLAFAIMAERRSLETTAQGSKSLYYLSGLAEGFETVVALAAFCIWPQHFPVIAYGYATLCYLSAFGRILIAWRVLR